MPYYDLMCPRCGDKCETYLSYEEYDSRSFGDCGTCGCKWSPVAANMVCAYGTMKLHDKVFKEASMAAGFKITETKQIDQLEREGKMYAVTNPSRYKFQNDKNKVARNRAYKDKLGKAL